MDKFQKKRLDQLVKQAEKCEWVQLGKGDINIIYTLQNEAQEGYSKGYQEGYNKGIEYVNNDKKNTEDTEAALRVEHGIYP